MLVTSSGHQGSNIAAISLRCVFPILSLCLEPRSAEAKEYQLFVTLDGQRQPRTVPLADDQTDAFDLYPIVGADRPAVLRVNLGDRPFMYQADRVAHALEKRRAAKLEAAKKPR